MNGDAYSRGERDVNLVTQRFLSQELTDIYADPGPGRARDYYVR